MFASVRRAGSGGEAAHGASGIPTDRSRRPECLRLTRRLFWERLSAKPPDPLPQDYQGRPTRTAGYCRFTEDIPVKSNISECRRYPAACGTGMRVLLLLYFFVDRDA